MQFILEVVQAYALKQQKLNIINYKRGLHALAHSSLASAIFLTSLQIKVFGLQI